MKTFADCIHLAIAFDQNYLTPFYALITSVFENNKGNRIVIHCIATGLSDDQLNQIKQYVHSKKSEICFYSIDEQAASKFVLVSKWTSAVYYRLYFPLLISSEVKKLLYLDTDILVLKDLSQLFRTDLEQYPVAAVYDNYVKMAPQLGIHEEGAYFNSGVLLIDIRQWKEQQISEKAFQFLNDYPEKIKFVDQDALNAVLINNWKSLNSCYNTMYSSIPENCSRKQLSHLLKKITVLHFTLQRPWQLLCRNRYRHFYFYYLEKSPLKKYNKYTDFQWKKVPSLLQLRLVEWYHDSPFISKIWRQVKNNLIQNQ
jgi:lipopolysaccharide biosynthesis glycosyltransferase